MEDTPMMKQYQGFKKQYPDKILLYRMGDFFETFGEDAKITSKVLNITLTTRDKKNNPTPLAGFPHKAIDQYLPKLIEGGYCVVVVDQLEDPKFAKGIVKRGITRIVTPGTLDGERAKSSKNQYLAAFFKEKDTTSVALCDVSTGEFLLVSGNNKEDIASRIITSYDPEEILLVEGEESFRFDEKPVHFVSKGLRKKEYSAEVCKDFFEVKSIENLGLENESLELVSVAMILEYIKETQLMSPKHIQKPRKISIDNTMILDRATIRNLELIRNAYSGDISNSLLSVLDETSTPMGKRLLFSWILNPLLDKKSIEERLEKVDKLFADRNGLEHIRERLNEIGDVERIVGKIGLGRVNARDFNYLQLSLKNFLEITDILKKDFNISFDIDRKLVSGLIEKIEKTISDSPPLTILEGDILKTGFNKEVDELRALSGDSKTWLEEFEAKEKKDTGISSLKISFNKVFGYYIEVTNAHKEKVPERYIRKQTLVNAERYITEELKEKENIILNAQEEVCTLEYNLFCEFRDSFFPVLSDLQKYSNYLSNIDVLVNFAYIAHKNNYCRPEIFEMGEKDGVIMLEKGRHPIIENIIEEEFISNNTQLDSKENRMCILTGPNMSGKSTYIRQVAVIILMAQIGCFVPAHSAKISLVDRIFTRVGASDDLARGRSTFMVEMDEAANIVNNATKYSLIVLDEIGRGTSTYDGVSIAWALAEHLITEIGARTLFATHYHELLKLEEKYPESVKNYNVMVEENIEEGTVIFLRKIIQGGTDRSYGIYVAKMAGLPNKVIKRANEILESFEQESMFVKKNELRDINVLNSTKSIGKNGNSGFQYPLFTAKDSEIEKEIQSLDLDNLTPIEALNKIVGWKKKI